MFWTSYFKNQKLMSLTTNSKVILVSASWLFWIVQLTAVNNDSKIKVSISNIWRHNLGAINIFMIFKKKLICLQKIYTLYDFELDIAIELVQTRNFVIKI